MCEELEYFFFFLRGGKITDESRTEITAPKFLLPYSILCVFFQQEPGNPKALQLGVSDTLYASSMNYPPGLG